MAIIKVWMVALLSKLLLLLCSSLASEQVYHITPASSYPCPEKPCLTLLQFASQIVSINTTLMVLPGKHSLESRLSVANIGTLLMISEHNDFSTRIACYRSGSLKFTNVHSVHIRGLDFIGCAGNLVENVDNFTLEGSHFLGQEDNTKNHGAALELYSTSTVILRSTFTLNTGNVQQVHSFGYTYATFSAERRGVLNADRYRRGGAIFSINSSTTIADCRFERNSATIGGAIFAEFYGSVTAINSVFVKNYVRVDTSITMSHNKCFGGGVLFAGNSVKVKIHKSQFYQNTAYKDLSGGVVMAGLYTIINISASKFINNHAMSSCGGGVIYITDSHSAGYLAYTDGEVVGTSQENETSIFARTHSIVELLKIGFGKLVIVNSKFVNNSAIGCAGVIKVDTKASYSSLSVVDSKFFRNSAQISGGVIHIHTAEKSMLKIMNSVFTGNSAGVNGGVIHSDQTSVTISNSCTFDHNTALGNGGVIVNYQGNVKILDKCKFNSNEAYNNGGVIHTCQGTINITNGNNFNNNMACSDGGVIYALESDLHISRTNIFDNNTAYNGGVINTFESNLTIGYRNTFRKNAAHKDGGAIYTYQSNTIILMENIFSHNVAVDGAVINAYQQNLDISDAKFIHNKASNDGGAIWAHKVNTTTMWSVYGYNYAGSRGGVWSVYKGFLKVLHSNLSHNQAMDGGAIFTDMGNITAENTNLVGNRASKGGALHTYQSTLFIVSTSFSRNSARRHGGGWHMQEGSALVMDSAFEQNSASDQGGTWRMEDSNVALEEIIITSSSANIGGALYANGCTMSASKSLRIKGNVAHTMGTVYLSHGSFRFDGETEFSENYGSLVVFNSNSTFLGTTMITNCSEPVRLHDKLDVQDKEGGGLTLFKSHVVLGGNTLLLHNYAEDGGGILAAESRLYVYGDTLVESNIAYKKGGGLYLFHSELNNLGNSSLKLFGNKAAEKGGGIHAISSTVNIQANTYYTDERNLTVYSSSKLYFVENKAEMGGGLYLDIYAKLYVLKSTPYTIESHEVISFTHNLASYGGAIYASECSDSGTCPARSVNYNYKLDPKARECSIQILIGYNTRSKQFDNINETSKSIFFHENSANVSGSSVFQELKQHCRIFSFSGRKHMSTMSVDGVSYLINISTINKDDIGSKPAQLCFCQNGKIDCNYHPHLVRVKKGGRVSVELIALDYVGNPVNAIVHSTLLQSVGHLGDGQTNKITNRTCTEFNFDIFSTNDNEILNMVVAYTSVKETLNIQFTTCNACPIGFARRVDENSICKCVCDPKLKPYITACNVSQEVLIRDGEFWITYVNTSENATSGYLTYPFCPYNYCIPPTTTVEINLNLPDGADSQCVNGHSGLLCGQCQSGLSLSLGSSQCLSCSSKWPIILMAILTVAFLAGIILVAILISVNLTVAVGTLNSIIFYANIVEANNSIFLPFSKPNFATIFIDGLNLKIGFDTCFFEGMDAYWKTLLQLAFPLYVISLVIMIIFASEHSTRFAKLLARKNPVATLATLILLSYSKQLQTIISTLSFATLQYPDGSSRTVWLPDASVEYLKGKHIVLFITAILILLAGALYTILLFTWQWLLRHQDKTLLRWMKYQKLCHFIEPYHAPYNFSQRYWFGLLLIARIPVYIVSAVTRDPRVKLLFTSAVILCLLVVKIFSLEKQIYRKRLLDIFDTIVHVNIICFAALTSYIFDIHSSQQIYAAIAHFSVCVTLTLLVCVILYHTLRYTSLYSAICKTKTSVAKLLVFRRNVTDNHMSRVPDDDTSESMTFVTYSTVELSECTVAADPRICDDNDPVDEAHSRSLSRCED